jgi:hypothetical protein
MLQDALLPLHWRERTTAASELAAHSKAPILMIAL